MSRLLACLVLAAGAGPVAACINDIELPTHEREFRSQYRAPDAPATVSPEPDGRPGTGLLVGAGVVFLVAGTVVAVAGRRAGI